LPKKQSPNEIFKEMFEICQEFGPDSMRTLGRAAKAGDVESAKALQRFFTDYMKLMGEGEASETLKTIQAIRAGKRPQGRPMKVNGD
jgi:dihydrodipicolinate synthase/N-acetylneuraminate lyase